MYYFLMVAFLMNGFAVYASDRRSRPRRPEHQITREIHPLASLCLGLETMLLDYENRLNLERATNRTLLAQLVWTQAQLARSEADKLAFLVELNDLSGELIVLRADLSEAERQLAVRSVNPDRGPSAAGSGFAVPEAPQAGFLSPGARNGHEDAARRTLPMFRR